MTGVLMTATELAKLNELGRLLDEAGEHFQIGSGVDPEAGEGWIQLSFGEHPDCEDGRNPIMVKIVTGLAQPRTQWFQSIDEALGAVRSWHATEMANEHPDPVAEWWAQAEEDSALTDPDPDGGAPDDDEPDSDELPEPNLDDDPPELESDDADF